MVAIAGVSRGSSAARPLMCLRPVVTKGEFIDYLQVRGEMKAVRSVPLTVPTTGGGDLHILELAKTA